MWRDASYSHVYEFVWPPNTFQSTSEHCLEPARKAHYEQHSAGWKNLSEMDAKRSWFETNLNRTEKGKKQNKHQISSTRTTQLYQHHTTSAWAKQSSRRRWRDIFYYHRNILHEHLKQVFWNEKHTTQLASKVTNKYLKTKVLHECASFDLWFKFKFKKGNGLTARKNCNPDAWSIVMRGIGISFQSAIKTHRLKPHLTSYCTCARLNKWIIFVSLSA